MGSFGRTLDHDDDVEMIGPSLTVFSDSVLAASVGLPVGKQGRRNFECNIVKKRILYRTVRSECSAVLSSQMTYHPRMASTGYLCK